MIGYFWMRREGRMGGNLVGIVCSTGKERMGLGLGEWVVRGVASGVGIGI